MSFWVYILRCSDNSYYTGHTDNLESRIAQHAAGAIPGCYTFTRRPVECVFSQAFVTRAEALASERQIKGWSRKKKEAMMRGDWAEISRLAQPKTGPSTGSGRTDDKQPAARIQSVRLELDERSKGVTAAFSPPSKESK